jgi:hypothetical protein
MQGKERVFFEEEGINSWIPCDQSGDTHQEETGYGLH